MMNIEIRKLDCNSSESRLFTWNSISDEVVMSSNQSNLKMSFTLTVIDKFIVELISDRYLNLNFPLKF